MLERSVERVDRGVKLSDILHVAYANNRRELFRFHDIIL